MLLGLGYGTYELSLRALPYADQPIAKISVEGDLSYVNQQAVQQRIAPYASASFFSVDLLSLRHVSWRRCRGLPAPKCAGSGRISWWCELEEQLPIARWGDEALLNNQGEAFTPRRSWRTIQHLPQLYGPKRAQQQVMQQYQVISQMLRPDGLFRGAPGVA